MNTFYKQIFQRAGVAWTCCIVLFTAAYVFVLIPQQRLKEQLAAECLKTQLEYNMAIDASRNKTIEKLSGQIAMLKQNCNSFVTNGKDSGNLTLDIGKIADKRKIASFKIRPKKSRQNMKISADTLITEQCLNLTFTCNFNQFAMFLNDLERRHPVVFVDNFAITRSTSEGTGHFVKMSLSAFVNNRQGG